MKQHCYTFGHLVNRPKRRIADLSHFSLTPDSSIVSTIAFSLAILRPLCEHEHDAVEYISYHGLYLVLSPIGTWAVNRHIYHHLDSSINPPLPPPSQPHTQLDIRLPTPGRQACIAI